MPVGKNLKDDDESKRENTEYFFGFGTQALRKMLHKEMVYNDKNTATSISFRPAY